MSTTTWILAADASRARVLQVMDQEGHLSEIESLENPAGRMHDRDLTSDAYPRFNGTTGPGNDREEKGASEIEAEKFARELGQFLDKARTGHRYDRLHLVAPPRFLGMLRKELGKEVEKLVTSEMPKDLSWLDARELEKHLARGNGPGR